MIKMKEKNFRYDDEYDDDIGKQTRVLYLKQCDSYFSLQGKQIKKVFI